MRLDVIWIVNTIFSLKLMFLVKNNIGDRIGIGLISIVLVVTTTIIVMDDLKRNRYNNEEEL